MWTPCLRTMTGCLAIALLAGGGIAEAQNAFLGVDDVRDHHCHERPFRRHQRAAGRGKLCELQSRWLFLLLEWENGQLVTVTPGDLFFVTVGGGLNLSRRYVIIGNEDQIFGNQAAIIDLANVDPELAAKDGRGED
jgi:hypothetical protein